MSKKWRSIRGGSDPIQYRCLLVPLQALENSSMVLADFHTQFTFLLAVVVLWCVVFRQQSNPTVGTEHICFVFNVPQRFSTHVSNTRPLDMTSGSAFFTLAFRKDENIVYRFTPRKVGLTNQSALVFQSANAKR